MEPVVAFVLVSYLAQLILIAYIAGRAKPLKVLVREYRRLQNVSPRE
jgi:hypothetical protein